MTLTLTPAAQAELRADISRIKGEDLAAARKAGLAGCPFCRGATCLVSRPDGPLLKGSYAGCHACDIFTPIKDTDEAAVALWNRWTTHAKGDPTTARLAAAHVMALIEEYWNLAHAEGKEGRQHDTPDGAAGRCLHRLQAAVGNISAGAPSTSAPLHVTYGVYRKTAGTEGWLNDAGRIATFSKENAQSMCLDDSFSVKELWLVVAPGKDANS